MFYLLTNYVNACQRICSSLDICTYPCSYRKSVMHPLKKDEFALINKMKFETKNVLEHLNRVANQSKKINREEMERRLTELSRYSKKLALLQREIDLEIDRQI